MPQDSLDVHLTLFMIIFGVPPDTFFARLTLLMIICFMAPIILLVILVIIGDVISSVSFAFSVMAAIAAGKSLETFETGLGASLFGLVVISVLTLVEITLCFGPYLQRRDRPVQAIVFIPIFGLIVSGFAGLSFSTVLVTIIVTSITYTSGWKCLKLVVSVIVDVYSNFLEYLFHSPDNRDAIRQ